MARKKTHRNLYQRKRSGVWYFRKYRKERVIRLSLETTVLTEAKVKRDKEKEFYWANGYYPTDIKIVEAAAKVAEKTVLFGELAVKWFKMRKGKYKKSTRRDYRNSLNHFILKRFGNVAIKEITTFDIECFISEQNVTANRAQNLLQPMRNVFAMAKKAGFIDKNPCIDVDTKANTIRARKPKPTPFSMAEVDLMIEHFDPFYKDFATVMFFTGMRFSEAAGLKWKNVDLARGIIRIEEVMVEDELDLPKTEDSQRDIELFPMVIDALRNQRKATWGRSEFVFLNQVGGTLHPTPFNQKMWKKACAKAGIPYRAVKNTRSTFICMMLDAGEDMGWVARQVGHSSFKMIYEHYYKYMKDDRAGGKFMEAYGDLKKKTPGNWSQIGHTCQGSEKNNEIKQQVKWSGRLDLNIATGPK